jgi:RNA polymerase sigma-70 factor (ECF subfamily)
MRPMETSRAKVPSTVAGAAEVERTSMSQEHQDPDGEAPDSFSAFYARNYGHVLRLVYVMSGRWDMAEEITQEAFLRAFDRWEGQLVHPSAWVRTTAVNLTRSRFRRLHAEMRALTRWQRSATAEPTTDPIPQELSAFWSAVRRLPRRQAEAIALYYLEDRSIAEVAQLMQCAEGTVKALLHQGRQRLGERIHGEQGSRS